MAKGGRPAWRPKNPELARAMVEALVGFGVDQVTIGQLLDPPCSKDVIQKYYRAEIDSGAQMLRARAEATLALLALGRPEVRVGKRIVQRSVPPDRASLFFLLKTRYGYREVSRTEHSFDGVDIGSLTETQLAQLIERLDRALATRSGGAAAEDAEGADGEVQPVRH